jgi:hypothetical protein
VSLGINLLGQLALQLALSFGQLGGQIDELVLQIALHDGGLPLVGGELLKELDEFCVSYNCD